MAQARENASDQVAIGFSFASDWLGRWREIFRPIIDRSKAKPMQSRITFDTRLKIALTHSNQPMRLHNLVQRAKFNFFLK